MRSIVIQKLLKLLL